MKPVKTKQFIKKGQNATTDLQELALLGAIIFFTGSSIALYIAWRTYKGGKQTAEIII